MSYRINASSNAGAVSIPVCSSADAWARADALASEGHRNIVIIDAGTGMPVKRPPAFCEDALRNVVSSGPASERNGGAKSAGVVQIQHAIAAE